MSNLELYVTEEQDNPPRIRIERAGLSGVLTNYEDGLSGNWTIFVNHPGQLHAVVKVTLAYALSFDKKVLLHASGVVRRNKLWLFSGLSGHGKSTIAENLNNGGRLFCTDQAVLFVADGVATAYPTPFSDLENQFRSTTPMTPAGVVFIDQASSHSLERLSAVETGKRLLENIHFIPGQVKRTQALLDAAAEISASVPGYSLKFSKDEGFWSLLDRCESEGFSKGT